MLEPEELFELSLGLLTPQLLAGKRVLLTAGPTLEAIDPVRALTNLSSGKMGYALARACRDAGAEVTLVSGPTALSCPPGVTRLDVHSASDMLAAVEQQLPGQDVFIAVAAVADYHVANRSDSKLKKEGGVPQLQLAENPDILARIAARPDAPFCVGFAAESDNLLAHAQAKRQRKGIPLLVANLAQQAMGADANQVTLLDDHGTHPLPLLPKQQVAAAIVQHLASLLPG